jgi:excisionase family DNA binding protein
MTSHKEPLSPRLLTVDEVAEYLGLSSQSVRHMVYRRQLPFIRLGAKRIRFDVAEIDAWISSQRVAAVG